MPSLGAALVNTCRKQGNTPALIFDDRAYTFRELDARTTAFARALQQRGVRPGDRVIVGLANSLDLVAAVLGTLRAGAVLVPLNPSSTPEELLYIAGDAQARLALVSPAHAGVLTAAALPEPSTILTSVDTTGAAEAVLPSVDPEAPALIVYTSGTTGRPKGVVLSHRALLSNFLGVAAAWRWTPNDRLLLTLPCYHLHGLGLGIITSALVGSSVVLRPRFVVEEVCEDLARSEATMFFGVPTMYNRLVALPEASLARADLHRMRLWVSGSAPLTAATFERFRQRFGRDLLERYGMTECGFVLSTPYEGPHRPGVVGWPLPGISVRLVDLDAAAIGNLIDVPDGTQGEIIIRGPNLFSGYWNRPAETRAALADGYLRSGDLAIREPDGMFRIVGRRSVDIIKTRGFKVSAVEIEDCLQRHPQIQEVAVVGVPDRDQGERVVAVIMPVPEADLTPDVLRAFARDHLAPHKVPMDFVLVADIPRTGPGKFKKKELIARLQSAAGRDGVIRPNFIENS